MDDVELTRDFISIRDILLKKIVGKDEQSTLKQTFKNPTKT